jgi:hypothetical protein
MEKLFHQKKRRNILYFAISLLCESQITNEEIIRPSQQEMVGNILKKIDQVYKQIKKNEESPNTDYLFANMERESTFEQSMRKMEIVNNMDFLSK